MWPVSGRFLDAIRSGGVSPVVRVDAFERGRLVAQDMEVTGGVVTVDGGSQVRRQLAITFPHSDATWRALEPSGVELYVWRGFKFPGTAEPELVPLGVFGVDAQRMSIGPSGDLSLTCADRWVRVQRARFLTPRVSRLGIRVVAEITDLIREAVPPVPAIDVQVRVPAGVSGELTKSTVWPRDRDEAILTMARADGLDVAFCGDGCFLIRAEPKLSDRVVWQVNAGEWGVLKGGERERNRQRTYNTVVVSATRADGTAPFPPEVVEDDDPASPTFVGRYGRVPYFINNPLLTNPSHARSAGITALLKVKALAAQVSAESVVNPALDAGNVVEVTTDVATGATERHLIDRVTIPLDAQTGQQITTRSTRPEGDVPEEAPSV